MGQTASALGALIGAGAEDLVVLNLPDLSLTPRLVEWIEAHFGFEKLRPDYPHWNDAR